MFVSLALGVALSSGSVELALDSLLLGACCVLESETAYSIFRNAEFMPADAVFVGVAILSALLAAVGRLGIPGFRHGPAGQRGMAVVLMRRGLLAAAVLCACGLLFRTVYPKNGSWSMQCPCKLRTKWTLWTEWTQPPG